MFLPFALKLAALGAALTSVHSSQLTWTASPDSVGVVNASVTVYRALGTCSANSGFSPLATAVPSAGPYTDSTIGVGSYAYQITAVVGGAESSASNCVTVTVLPSPPSALTGTAK